MEFSKETKELQEQQKTLGEAIAHLYNVATQLAKEVIDSGRKLTDIEQEFLLAVGDINLNMLLIFLMMGINPFAPGGDIKKQIASLRKMEEEAEDLASLVPLAEEVSR